MSGLDKMRLPTTNNDEKIIEVARSELRRNGYDHFELSSITSLKKPDTSFVIAKTGFLEISMEIDNKTGKIINKEKIAR